MSTKDQKFALLLSYSNEFKARLRRINTFIDHKASIGTSHEGILRRFLQQYVPRKFTVSEGFIVGGNGETSGQCDIIVWSSLDHSPLYSEGDFVIVQQEAVNAVIEVKTSLSKESLLTSFQQLRPIHRFNPKIYVSIFAFESSSLQKTARDIIYDLKAEDVESVDAICSLKGWALQRLGYEDANNPDVPGLGLLGIPASYVGKKSEDNEVLPFLPFSSGKDDGTAMATFLSFLFLALNLPSTTYPMVGLPLRLDSFIIPGIGRGVADVTTEKLHAVLEQYLRSLE